MNKNVLTIAGVLSVFALMAFSVFQLKSTPLCSSVSTKPYGVDFTLEKKPDFIYNVESRFMTRITKQNLLTAETILDIVPPEATERLSHYSVSTVGLLKEDGEEVIMGKNEVLTEEQKELIRRFDYSDNFFVKSYCKHTDEVWGNIQNYDLVYYMTVVPEKEATYEDGNKAFTNYLKENSKEVIKEVGNSRVQPGRVFFTVTKEGTIANAYLDSSSGYDAIDTYLLKLLKKAPGKWNPATDENGQAVDQELVFFFGNQGC